MTAFLLRFHVPAALTSGVYLTALRRRPVLAVSATLPARDRPIDFGKYKGKKLGSLPSSYLKWVSANLRARDFLDWAELADEVLRDPIYRDRIEWECAQRVLDGDISSSTTRDSNGKGEGAGSAAALLEIGERFGWDFGDNIGWSKVNFELLGTSSGGRLPRCARGMDGNKWVEKGHFRNDGGGGEVTRKARARARSREKREKLKIDGQDMMGTREKDKGRSGNVVYDERDTRGQNERDRTVYNPFPGREALLKKVLQAEGKRFL